MRILTIVSGVMMILTGLWCFANQGVAYAGLAFIIGIIMVINGIIELLAFVNRKNKLVGMDWVLAEATMAIILGIIVLSNQLATDLIIIMFFGMWMLFSGCNRIVGALMLKKQEDKAWRWIMSLGCLSALAGIYSFWNPILAGLTVGILIGIFFLIQGSNVLTLGIAMPCVKRRCHHSNSVKSKEK